MTDTQQIETKDQTEKIAKSLIATVTAAVDQYTPHAKPSPYSKLWFTPGLKVQQREVKKPSKTMAERLCEGWPSPPKNTGNVLRDAYQTKAMDPHDRKGQGSALERLPGPSHFPDGVAGDTILAVTKRVCQYPTSQK
jgi:hypothetical protein